MEERLEQELVARAQVGADITEFCKHPGFKVLEAHIESKIADAKQEWLMADNREKAEETRLKAKPYQEILTYLRKLRNEGAVASFNLRKMADAEESI
jgi:hypothetical protein